MSLCYLGNMLIILVIKRNSQKPMRVNSCISRRGREFFSYASYVIICSVKTMCQKSTHVIRYYHDANNILMIFCLLGLARSSLLFVATR